MVTAGRLGTRREVAESSSRLYGLSNVMVSPLDVKLLKALLNLFRNSHMLRASGKLVLDF